MALGSPDAPVTLVEYADLQCPYCAQWARETLPVLVDEYVETGKLRIVFHGLAFIGPDSDKALRTAIAAGRDEPPLGRRPRPLRTPGRGELRLGHRRARRRDRCRRPRARRREAPLRALGSSVEPELKRAAAAAERAGVHGTPAFQVGPTGGRLELVEVSSLGPEGIRPRDRGGAGAMSERALRLASAVIAVLGAAITAYLLYVRQSGGALVCSTGGCETVQSSSYAEVLGVPVAALGLVGFLGLLLAALARGEWARLSQATLALTAVRLRRLPALHPARRHRRDLRVVPRDRRAHDRDRRPGAAAPPGSAAGPRSRLAR